MNISFQNEGINLTETKVNNDKTHKKLAGIADSSFMYSLDISGLDKDINSLGKGNLENFDDFSSSLSEKSISLEHNAMAVMSNCLSDEDFAKLNEEGYSPNDMDIEETVTSLDRIKAVLLESGTVINGFNDDLSKEEITAITGNALRGEMIVSGLKENDLPVSETNVKDITEVLNTADTLEPATENVKKYMVSNELDPSVFNFYLARHSSKNVSDVRTGTYYVENGYIGIKGSNADFEQLKAQAESIIEESGITLNDKSLKQAEWLISNNLPLNKENLLRLSDIENVSFPLKDEQVIRSSCASIANGFTAKDANLNVTVSMLSTAKTAKSEVLDYINNLKPEEIKNKRIVEEIRLSMTTEANLNLLRKGIQIDTKDLESLVENLKKAEEEIYKPLLANADTTDTELRERINLYKESINVIEDIKDLPFSAMAEIDNVKTTTLPEIRESGSNIKSALENAGKAYETMRTEIRPDLGDSIKKAFTNVEDILEDLELELSNENKRAVKILGYAEMEVTEENIDRVSRADTIVNNLLQNMTPARVLKLIRNGNNPLDMDIASLNEEIMFDEDESNEKFSVFLHNLERRQEINSEEKEAFLGFFRLIKTIEKSEGKLTGRVLKADDKLTLNNLLKASRVIKASNMNIKIDEKFGALDKLISNGASITDQILKGFTSKEDTEHYVKDKLKDAENALKNNEQAKELLENIDEPVTVNNINAVKQLLSNPGNTINDLMKRAEKDDKKGSELKKKAENILDSFGSEEELNEAVSDFTKEGQDVIKSEINSTVSYEEYKLLSSGFKQLTIVNSLKNVRDYELPLEIDGEYTSINLKIINNSENAGKVNISFTHADFGKVFADFSLDRTDISGLIISESKRGSDFIKSKEESFRDKLDNLSLTNIFYTEAKDLTLDPYINENAKEASNNNLLTIAKAFLKAVS